VFPIHITHDGTVRALQAGDRYARPRDLGFRDTAASDLNSLIAEIESGRPWREAVAARYESAKPWLYRIITDPSRTAFFDGVLPAGPGAVLDLGAGWGQIARPLARQRPVVALEPVAERLAFIQAAARQDGLAGNMAFVEADYFEVAFESRFAAITAIGVLEWAGAFQNHADPQERQRAFLRKARGELAAGGCLVVGIENRLGLKYLLGCPDDHLGVPHVASLPAPLARRRWTATSGHTLQSFTYSQAELAALLREAGFARADFFAAFPDYKLPAEIVDLGDGGEALNRWLRDAASLPPEHNGYDGSALSTAGQERLRTHYRRLAATGRAHLFVPSFFVRAWAD
jgi:hypothetical protein